MICLSLIGFSAACTSHYKVHPVLYQDTTRTWYGKKYIDPLNLKTFKFAEDDVSKDQKGELAYIRAAADTADRNRLQSIILDRSDAICEQHKADAFGLASNVNLVLTAITAAFSGSAAIVTGVAASALSGGAAFITGGQAAVNENIYHKLFVGTIVAAIDKSRTEQRKVIENNAQKTSTSTLWTKP